jgi:hypothetical protein
VEEGERGEEKEEEEEEEVMEEEEEGEAVTARRALRRGAGEVMRHRGREEVGRRERERERERGNTTGEMEGMGQQCTRDGMGDQRRR